MKSNVKILFIVMVFLLVSSVLTVFAEERDSDLDGVPDSIDKYPFDYDNDGMPDVWEKKMGLRYDVNDAYEDPDNDGIRNIDEYKQGTDPLVSEKTKERVSPELLTPVERTMVRGLVWGGSLLFLFMIVIFILYRTHIFRIFKFIHHISREHFEQHAREHFNERKVIRPYGPRPVYRGRGILPPQHRASQYPRGVFLQRPVRREVPKQAIFTKPRLPQEEIKREEKKDIYVPPAEYQEAHPAKEESFEKVDERIEEKKPVDVFGRLSEHIHEYKKRESLNSNKYNL